MEDLTTDQKISEHVSRIATATIEKVVEELRKSVSELQPLAGQSFLDLIFKAMLEIDVNLLLNAFEKIGMKDNTKNRQRFFNAYIKMLIKTCKAVSDNNLVKFQITH